MMPDHDRTVMHTVNGRPGRLADFDDFTFGEQQPSDVATGLVSLRFVGAAIMRAWRLACVLAIVGLVGGVGYYAEAPPAFKASTSVLLTYGPAESPASAIFDNQTIAESHAVAQLAMNQLGDTRDSIGTFAAAYTVAVVTDRVLLIQASGTSSAQAVARAKAIATVFLRFRVSQDKAIQAVQVTALNQEASQARQNVSIIQAQVTSLQAQGGSPAQVKALQDKLQQAQLTAGVIEQEAASTQAGDSTLQADAGSIILDPAAPLPNSKTKKLLEFAAYGLIGGLAIGVALAAIGAVISDRLRRRDDIARALGAPVRLSVGPVRLAGRLPRTRRGLAAAGDVEVRRIVAHLRGVIPAGERKTALAIIAVGDPDIAALTAVSLATSCAEDGRKVVLADLAAGAPATALLDAKGAGVRQVGAGKSQLVLAVPDSAEIAPVGPVGRVPEGQRSEFNEKVNMACAPADLLLTLITLDPAVGADHLPSWASTAVAVVTAGKASWTQVHAVGEMARLAGTPLASAVLVGADKSDESLGTLPEPEQLLDVSELS